MYGPDKPQIEVQQSMARIREAVSFHWSISEGSLIILDTTQLYRFVKIEYTITHNQNKVVSLPISW